MLKPEDPLWPGPRQVTLEIKDQQGLMCPEKQVLKLDVCTCDKSAMCATTVGPKKSSKLGGAGIGLLLLGFLALLRKHPFYSSVTVIEFKLQKAYKV